MTERVADRRAIIGGGALLASAGALALPARARAADAAGHWQPATETQDDWMDKPRTRHRLLFEPTAPPPVAPATFPPTTSSSAHKSETGLDQPHLVLIIVPRHYPPPSGTTTTIKTPH